MVEDKNQLTIFEVKNDQFQKAFESFISGKTPNEVIKQKDGKGGGKENFVNIYWMTEQISLLTGFRWTSECLEEKALPNWDKPRELGAKIRVTIWDKDNRQYQHTSWGQKQVGYYKLNHSDKTKAGQPLSIFDDLKAAYSDGIKKCLSYFGIARDVYGGKEMEFFSDDNSTGTDNVEDNSNKAMDEFDRYITKIGMQYNKVFEILKITSLDEIKDYKQAYETIKAYKESK
jgi:hypothetical protein